MSLMSCTRFLPCEGLNQRNALVLCSQHPGSNIASTRQRAEREISPLCVTLSEPSGSHAAPRVHPCADSKTSEVLPQTGCYPPATCTSSDQPGSYRSTRDRTGLPPSISTPGKLGATKLMPVELVRFFSKNFPERTKVLFVLATLQAHHTA